MNNSNNIFNLLQQAEQILLDSPKYIEDSKRDAQFDASILLAYVLAKPRVYLLTWPEQLLSIGQTAMFFALVERRAQGEPIAYITNQKEFFSLILSVNNSVLIPRPETELLVETVLAKYEADETIRILDLGTGSGAISIALAKTRPNWQVTAIDKSATALEVAKKNAKTHNTANIEFILSDWFENLSNQKFDCIVANPPYIDSHDTHLSNGDVKFEPMSALVAKNNGLADIEHIISYAPLYLNLNGILIFEHGYNQLPDIKNIFTELENNNKKNKWTNFESIKDYSDCDRAVILQCE